MDISDVQKSVQNAYDLQIQFIEKIKSVYKIHTEDKQYCLKVIKYDLGHFMFILSAIKHLQYKGFNSIPNIIKTKNKREYISLEGNYAYLTKWVNSRECNYDNPVDVLIAASKLAELHKKSMGFELAKSMNPRIGWFKWIETFKIRKNEMLDFKKRIYKKEKQTEFDEIYVKMIGEELKRTENSINHLIKSEYFHVMKDEIANKGFCHHDYANHNVLLDTNGKVNIIDFDYCILDSHLHDLASLLIRRMKNGKWSIESALSVLEAYNSINKVNQIDIPIMAAFMEFPQDYWQVGIQYYWEKQPWNEEFFLKKLRKINVDKDEKQEFLDEFRLVKYS